MERHVHKRRTVDERSSAPSVVYKRRGGLFRRARCPHRALDIARKATYNSQESCAVVTKIVLARCPSTPPSSNVKLSQLSIDGHNNEVSLTSTMLITETHKDVPTKAGGDMSMLLHAPSPKTVRGRLIGLLSIQGSSSSIPPLPTTPKPNSRVSLYFPRYIKVCPPLPICLRFVQVHR